MFSNKKKNLPGSKTLTVIAEGVMIEGNIYSRGSTRIDGTFKGEIVTEKELVIGRSGKVSAKIKTNNAVIAGNLEGSMVASGEVEIAATGKFIGNLIQKDAQLSVEKGGLFKGESIISEDNETFKFPDPDDPEAKNPLDIGKEPDKESKQDPEGMRNKKTSNKRIEEK